MVLWIGHLAYINPFQVDRAGYHEIINDLISGTAQGKIEKDKAFFTHYNTAADMAKTIFSFALVNLSKQLGRARC
eukprot:5986781-Ditylum_brightwellii.AAC.1